MDRIFDRIWKEFDSDPFSAMTRWPEPMGRMTNWPAMDLAEDDKAVTIHLDVPGLDAKDVDVEVSGNQLSIRGQRQDEFKQEEKGVYRRERYSGSFARTITLPSYVDSGKVDAKYDKGTLTITAPKIPGQGPKRVQVKSQ
jgi:HSP20 family protein